MAPPLILSYHAVSSSWRSPLAVPVEVLGSQLALLARGGWVGLTFAEAERRRAAGTLPDRAVVVTFDDGFASVLHARPLLDAVAFPATVFVVTAFADSEEPLHWEGIEPPADAADAHELRPLGWSDLEQLVNAGWEVGSHTVTHPVLVGVDDERLAHELQVSRHAVSARLGRCETIAYPYGIADARVARAAEAAGYLAGCTFTRAHRVDERYLRPRLPMYRHDSGVRLRLKLSRAGTAVRRSRLALAVSRTSVAG